MMWFVLLIVYYTLLLVGCCLMHLQLCFCVVFVTVP
jgi:hypothetical protein